MTQNSTRQNRFAGSMIGTLIMLIMSNRKTEQTMKKTKKQKKEKTKQEPTWHLRAHLCRTTTSSTPAFTRLLCGRAALKPTSPHMLAQGGSHELNTNWELRRFECEFWERRLNGVCPWVQLQKRERRAVEGCVCARPQVDGFNPHALSVMWPWLNFHYVPAWPRNEFGALALSGICTTAPLCSWTRSG